MSKLVDKTIFEEYLETLGFIFVKIGKRLVENGLLIHVQCEAAAHICWRLDPRSIIMTLSMGLRLSAHQTSLLLARFG